MGGRELIVTYIFGHMLPQKCNLHFWGYLDKCNLHFWGAIQDFFHFPPMGGTYKIVTYIFETPPENHG